MLDHSIQSITPIESKRNEEYCTPRQNRRLSSFLLPRSDAAWRAAATLSAGSLLPSPSPSLSPSECPAPLDLPPPSRFLIALPFLLNLVATCSSPSNLVESVSRILDAAGFFAASSSFSFCLSLPCARCLSPPPFSGCACSFSCTLSDVLRRPRLSLRSTSVSSFFLSFSPPTPPAPRRPRRFPMRSRDLERLLSQSSSSEALRQST
mmetsp:Transcript_78642/g.115171  ORF Transcript_78642/g.115171 Transcript_78642/m.115171 type:complete len:207 (+) Transcript_78642:101-721(+)